MDVQVTPEDRIRCRYCSFTTLKWRTLKDGRKASGWARLQHHLEDAHDIDTDLVGDE